jgi:hypothetical protein
VVLTVPYGHRSFCTENAQRKLNAFSRCKTFRVPGSDLASTSLPQLGFHQREDDLGILKQHSLFSFEHGNNVFVMLHPEIEKGGFHLQGVGQHPIKESSIATHRSFQQSFGRNDLPLSGLIHLHIQGNRHLGSH